MHVHALAWIVLAGIILTMIAVDIVGHVRTPHEPTLKEATWWSVAYIAIALLFGGIVWAVWGPQYGQEYLGGYITEKRSASTTCSSSSSSSRASACPARISRKSCWRAS